MQKPLFMKTRYFASADSKGGRDQNSIDALESLEDGADDIESLEEIGEHTEYDDMNPDGDDANDEMFMDAPVGESLMDDVDAYLREEEDKYDDEDDN